MLVAEVMTSHPVTLPPTETATHAAALMREHNIGDVLVVNPDGELRGIVTDRDLAIRVVAEGRNPDRAKLEECCSQDVTSVGVMDGVEQATKVMQEHAVRRVPVTDDDHRAVGIVSMGDIARRLNSESVLAAISKAPPNS